MRRISARFETNQRSLEAQIDRFARPFESRRAVPVEERSVYYDTFDWRLQRAGAELALTTRGDRAFLILSLDHGATEAMLPLDHAPAFASDLPRSGLRERLDPLTEMRRLMPIIEVRCRDRRLDILDEVDKTVARVSFVERSVRRGGTPGATARGRWVSLASQIRVDAIRGYEERFADVRRFASRSLGLERTRSTDLSEGLAALSIESGQDPSKLSVALPPDASAYEALQTILRALLGTMRANEAGTLADLDSEYLHDFRVAVRRTRAVLSEMGDVFSEEFTTHMKTEFRWLGSITGPTRDLDVLLLKLDDYVGLLDEARRETLAALANAVRARRAIERARMDEMLRSARYHTLVETWDRALHSAEHVGPAATRSVRSIADERVRHRAKRVFKRAARVGPECPARRVHKLRLECKKLRYLLEVFHGLCQPGPLGRVVKALKRIQTGLGDFNDYHVHADWLRELEPEPGTPRAAISSLIPRLEEAAEEARKATSERLTRFLTKANRHRFEELIERGA